MQCIASQPAQVSTELCVPVIAAELAFDDHGELIVREICVQSPAGDGMLRRYLDRVWARGRSPERELDKQASDRRYGLRQPNKHLRKLILGAATASDRKQV